jgi:hypothetical protein
MRGASYALIGLGVVILLFGVINHFAIHAGSSHTSTIIAAVGAVVAVIGGALVAMGGRSSAAH